MTSPLLQFLQDVQSDDLLTRVKASEDVERLEPTDLPNVVAFIRDQTKSPTARAFAVSNIPRFPGVPAEGKLAVLLAALAEPSTPVLWATVSALGKLGDRRAVPALAPLLHDPREHREAWWQPRVSDVARQALKDIGGPEAAALLK